MKALEAIESEASDIPPQAVVKQSESEKIAIRPEVNSPLTSAGTSDRSLAIQVVSSPHLTLQSNLKGVSQLAEKKRQSVTIADANVHFEFAPAKAHRSLSLATDYGHDDPRSNFLSAKEIRQAPECSSGSECPIESDAESGQQQRSTLADALTAPTRGHSTRITRLPP